MTSLQARVFQQPAKCVSKIQATLSAVLDYGVEHGLIATNPAASLRRRRKRSGGGKRSGGSKKALRGVGPEEILNAEEIAELLNVTPLGDPAYQVAIMVAALTGMRINEVLGLRWLNVDFGQAIIRVRESLTWVRRRGDTQSTWRLKVPQNWGT